MSDNGMAIQVLRTKLHRPPVVKDHLHRQRLLDRLDQHRHRPLTLVSAPAGYGKSILISSWLDTSKRPGAWLSLDENDNDLRRFLLNASILERFCAPLCDRLIEPDESSGMDGIDGEAFTAWAMASNLFVVPLDGDRQWYRYHHLFADLVSTTLKQRRSSEQVRELHRRASRWYRRGRDFPPAKQKRRTGHRR